MYFIKFILVSILIPTFVHSEDTNDTEEYRKHYGLSLNDGCAEYIKVFKCMSTCKSLSYKIYRLDFLCKCSCHVMKTSTILPFFKWRTNGTKKVPAKTQSPGQYDVIGTLSPFPEDTTTTVTTVDMCAGRFPEGWSPDGGSGNATGTDGIGTPGETNAAEKVTAAPAGAKEEPGAAEETAAEPAAAGGEATPEV